MHLQSQVSSTVYSTPPKQDVVVNSTETSVKIEQCEGDTTEPVDVNDVKTIDDSSCYAQTVRTYSSEEEGSQIPSPITDQK